MLHTSLIVELLRSQPRLMFWLATLAQGAMWWLVPSLFYASPPGDLPLVLAVGHEFQLGSAFGPPLAFWLAEIAFRIAGGPGVYLLAQACVVAAYYGVFTLARAIVGVHHAAFAVLLMAGIFAFAAPTPDFGPAILAMPLTAFALVNLWQAVGKRRRASWFLLALNLGLLLLTTYAGLILAAAIGVFLAATRRGRHALRSAEPWFASIVIIVLLFPHLIWLDLAGDRLFEFLLPAGTGGFSGGSWLGGVSGFAQMLLLSHVGLLLLVALGRPWRRGGKDAGEEKAPVFVRSFTSPFGERFVYFFAVAPALAATLFAGLSSSPPSPGSVAPYAVLSGLAVVVLAGNAIAWPRPGLVATAWALLLLAPPLGVVAAIVGLPWLGVPGAGVDRPAAAMGRYFAENFTRRTGAPLAIVAGEPGTAALVALGAPARPSLYLDAAPARTPWVTNDDIRRKGAVVVWPSPDTRAQVPAAIATRFPALVADVPRAFERAVQGRLPLLRIGWGVIRPQADAAR
jgi:4-amino-4-deoxy-L-arabinose transferase-like glycosyltransferase